MVLPSLHESLVESSELCVAPGNSLVGRASAERPRPFSLSINPAYASSTSVGSGVYRPKKHKSERRKNLLPWQY